jgi:glucan phosphoethanolaminetransferase (alkaline phosphatase superfamily)
MAVAAGVVMSTVDALLLQRSRSFFTGGFLSADHLTGPGAVVGFVAVSLVADAAVAGVFVALALWILERCRVRVPACVAGALLAALGPFIVTNVISYELLRYLGDTADLSLMFELTGGSVSELLAVAAAHLLVPVLLIVGASGAAGGLIWLLHRVSVGTVTAAASVRALWIPLLFGIVGLTITSLASASSDAVENGLRRKPSGKLLALVTNELTDLDGDRFGIAGRLPDPHPFDASVFPYALDVPGNGIDENGVGGDLSADVPPYIESPVLTTPWTRRPDFVLVVLESFRADLLNRRHAGRHITPVLDALGARGVSTTRAYSHNGYTAHSRYHLLAGSLSGVRDNRTLIDDFNANGYLTAYFSGQDESFGGAEHQVGFDRAGVAYDARVDRSLRYSTFTTAGSLAVPFRVVQDRIEEFLRRRGTSDEPLFLYVNFHDTHFPYTHEGVRTLISPIRLARHRIAPADHDALWATYVNTAANVDRAVGEVVEAVRRARGREPAVIVTADHGESLFDEGFLGHGYALNDVQTRIPLIVADLPIVIEEPFAQRDLRDAVGAALRVSADASLPPRLVRAENKGLFQYLGNLDRPRQIAFLGESGRTVYDFRSQRVQLQGGKWLPAPDLSGSDRTEFLALIHEWERVVLARRAKRPPSR